jgi:hypothetical protein
VTLTTSRPAVDCIVTDTFVPTAPEPPPTPTPEPGPAPPVPTPEPGPVIAGQAASIDPPADLVLTKRATPTRIRLGARVRYVVTVRNRGPAVARAVALVERSAYGDRQVVLHPSKGSCRGAPPRFCVIGELAVGQSATVTVTVRPRRTGRLTNVVATNMATRARSVGGQLASASIVVLPRHAPHPQFTG